MNSNNLYVSFVHGYEGEVSPEDNREQIRPALWRISENGQQNIYSYPFPRNKTDFQVVEPLLVGEPPLESAEDFEKKLPRFGLMGMEQFDNKFYAGAYNGIYEIDKSDLSLKRFISHRLMMDLHGVHADEKGLIHILTSKDTVVLTDYNGEITDYFEIDRELNVFKDDSILDTDWRFISKLYRGSCGNFHFNNVQRIGNKIWLTSRSMNCFIVVDMESKKASLKVMNLSTPSLLHDGVIVDDKFYFTSIDGKILIAEDSEGTEETCQEKTDYMHLYNRDLVARLIRLDETELGREPNWCRGIAVKGDKIYTTIDGRYGSDLSFGLLSITHQEEIIDHIRLNWSQIGDESKIRYVTGFDIIVD
jgi:hypothetical protein